VAKYQATTKLCRECHEDKPVDGFYRGRAVCKECIKKRRRVTYKDNSDKENAERAQRARRAKRQNDFRNAVLLDLLRQRGMTKDDVSRAAFR
jgi:hypothetical protein